MKNQLEDYTTDQMSLKEYIAEFSKFLLVVLTLKCFM